MGKLRKRETLGFRPETEAQEQFILAAQKATGLAMSDLIRRCVIVGLPRVVAEIKAEQERAITRFETAFREQAETMKRPSH